MAKQRKLGRPSDQRQAMLRNQVTNLIWHGRIETTAARAKEVRSIAERLITLAVRECENYTTDTKEHTNEKGQVQTVETRKDSASRLSARRRMLSYMYPVKEEKKDDENKEMFRERTKDIKHPAVEKLFSDIGPKYKKRAEEKGTGGGYTRMVKKGPRRGDAAEMVILELV